MAYGILCHVVNVQMTLLRSKFANIIIDDWNLDEIHANALEQKFGVLYILIVLEWIVVMDVWNLDEESLGNWQ